MLARRVELIGMKTCKYCGKEYPESYFGVALTTKNKVYRRHKCKFCYQKNKDRLKLKYKIWVQNFKKLNKCSKCGNDDPRVLEFHHRDRAKKDFSISVAFYNRMGLDSIRREIKKCDILCANCHRVLHWEENKW